MEEERLGRSWFGRQLPPTFGITHSTDYAPAGRAVRRFGRQFGRGQFGAAFSSALGPDGAAEGLTPFFT